MREVIKGIYILLLRHGYKINDLVIVNGKDLRSKMPSHLSYSGQFAWGSQEMYVMPEHIAYKTLGIRRKTSFRKFFNIWCGRSNKKITKNEPWR